MSGSCWVWVGFMSGSGFILFGLGVSWGFRVLPDYITNQGCNGAMLESYAQYINPKRYKSEEKIHHENAYPYVGNENWYKCQNKRYWNPGAKLDEALWDYKCGETKMKKLIYKYGSVLTAVYADDPGFENYSEGVFDTCRYVLTLFRNTNVNTYFHKCISIHK